jgi:predicted deacylase
VALSERRHQHCLIAIATYEVLGHAGMVLNPSDRTPFPDNLIRMQHSDELLAAERAGLTVLPGR